MTSAEVLAVVEKLKRATVQDIRLYGRDVLKRKRPDILLDSTRISDALVFLSRKGLVKKNPDGTWEVAPPNPQWGPLGGSYTELSHYVSPREKAIEAIRKNGGRAKIDQIYEFIAKAKGRSALGKQEQNTVRMAVLRLKKAGIITREAPSTYALAKTSGPDT
jgi:hypothetical protein